MKKVKRKISIFFTALTLTVSFASTELLAKGKNEKESLVALGDSIAFGYNLEDNNSHPSKDSYPELIGEEADLRVRNLGKPGWTTENLLTAIQNDQKFRQAVKHADYVTLSIGSNDLLQTLHSKQDIILNLVAAPDFVSPEELHEILGLPELLSNINQIVAEINELSDAEIVVYNIYNPFFTNDPRYEIGTALLPEINQAIAASITEENVEVVDAFTAFDSDDYLITGDIHPTETGHQVLAEIGYEAIQD